MSEKSPPEWFVPATDGLEFYTAERCYITELFNESDAPELSLALARVLPSVTTQLHALHGIEETYLIKSGRGMMEVDGVAYPVSSGDRVIIEAGFSQRITNNGTADLEFYCICRPRFTPDCYVSLENSPSG